MKTLETMRSRAPCAPGSGKTPVTPATARRAHRDKAGAWRRWRRFVVAGGIVLAFGAIAMVVALSGSDRAHGADEGSVARGGAAFLAVLRWVQGRGVTAALWLVALQALIVILAIPGPYFTLGAGFLFGLAGGSLTAVAGSTLGAVAAYGIARAARGASEVRARRNAAQCAEQRAERHGRGSRPGHAGHGGHGGEGAPGSGRVAAWLAAHPRAQGAERLVKHMMRHGDWKVVLSTRLVPLFPFKISNYVFGWARFPFAPFFWGTALGLVPITMVSVSVGSLASDMSGLTNPDLAGGGWIWSLAALAAGSAVLTWTGWRARATLRAEGAEGDEGTASRAEVKP